MVISRRSSFLKLSILTLSFVIAFFHSYFALASSDLFSLSITNQYESSTKYFYNLRPNVAGAISDQIRGVIVRFDNIANNNDYSISVTQSYPAVSFTTANDCFSSNLNNNQCPNNIPDGTYRVTVEASWDIYTDPSTYLFPKILVKIPSGANIDTVAPDRPVLGNIPSIIDADQIYLTGTAEINSAITVTGEGQTKTQQLSGGSNLFSVIVSLRQNSQNNFSVTAMDDAGNISMSVLATISETSPAPAAKTVSPSVTGKISPTTSPAISPAPTAGTTSPVSNSISKTVETSSIKGASTVSGTTEPSKTLMTILYASIILFLTAWALYFRRIYSMRRPVTNVDKGSKKSKK